MCTECFPSRIEANIQTWTSHLYAQSLIYSFAHWHKCTDNIHRVDPQSLENTWWNFLSWQWLWYEVVTFQSIWDYLGQKMWIKPQRSFSCPKYSTFTNDWNSQWMLLFRNKFFSPHEKWTFARSIERWESISLSVVQTNFLSSFCPFLFLVLELIW